MDTDYEINQENQNEILNFIIENIDVAETLRKLSKILYSSYENRKQQYLSNKSNKSKLKAKCN